MKLEAPRGTVGTSGVIVADDSLESTIARRLPSDARCLCLLVGVRAYERQYVCVCTACMFFPIDCHHPGIVWGEAGGKLPTAAIRLPIVTIQTG